MVEITPKTLNYDLYILNWARGICAILVVLGHSRVLGWGRGQNSILWEHSLGRIFLFPTSLGMESVGVFFVISGYLVGGKTYEQTLKKEFIWKRFLTDRLCRLWIVLIPGLIFTLFVDWAMGYKINISIKSGLCNIFFLMSSQCSSYGNNASLWSLGYEFYFYLAFALVSVFLFQLKSSDKKILYICLFFLLSIIFTPKLFILFPAWLIGVLGYIVETKLLSTQLMKIKIQYLYLGVPLLLAGFFISDLLSLSENMTILFISIPAFFFTISVVVISKRTKKRLCYVSKTLDFFGSSSYSIYVFHLPAILFYFDLYSHFPGFLGISQIYLVSFLAVAFSSSLYFLFEKNTSQLRKIIYHKF